ncbi:hypothetical protein XPA_001582 [Xanthoria parietina]
MDVVYISPRSKDMEVFESIVQHPVFNGAIKHVVYDSAQIICYSLKDYYNALKEQLEGSEYKRLRITNAAVQEMMDVIKPPFESCSSTLEGFHRFQDRPDLIEDFRQQNQIALTQETHIDSPWFAGVCKGLRKLGPIQSVTIRNTWDMTYDEDNTSDTSGCTSEIGDDTHPGSKEDDQDIENMEDQWENCGSSDASTIDMMSTKTPGSLRCDGTRLVGSPLARCWPPTWLNPPTDQSILSHRKNSCGLPYDEWYSIRQEFLLVTQLLKTAGKQPLVFGVPGNSDHSESLSQHALKSPDAETVHDSPFLYLAGNLKVLHLSIALPKEGASQPLVPSLPLLRAFLEKAKSLVSLTLIFAVETWRIRDPDDSENDGYSLYKFTEVFPTLGGLVLNNLSTLHVCGLEINYRDLVRLLFLQLSKLTSLYFSNVQLMGGGHWGNFIEGLREIRQLDRCSLNPSLLYPNFQIYTSHLSCISEEDFLNANSNYILHGGRHPNLKNDEVDGASLKYLESLNQELDKVKSALGDKAYKATQRLH